MTDRMVDISKQLRAEDFTRGKKRSVPVEVIIGGTLTLIALAGILLGIGAALWTVLK